MATTDKLTSEEKRRLRKLGYETSGILYLEKKGAKWTRKEILKTQHVASSSGRRPSNLQLKARMAPARPSTQGSPASASGGFNDYLNMDVDDPRRVQYSKALDAKAKALMDAENKRIKSEAAANERDRAKREAERLKKADKMIADAAARARTRAGVTPTSESMETEAAEPAAPVSPSEFGARIRTGAPRRRQGGLFGAWMRSRGATAQAAPQGAPNAQGFGWVKEDGEWKWRKGGTIQPPGSSAEKGAVPGEAKEGRSARKLGEILTQSKGKMVTLAGNRSLAVTLLGKNGNPSDLGNELGKENRGLLSGIRNLFARKGSSRDRDTFSRYHRRGSGLLGGLGSGLHGLFGGGLMGMLGKLAKFGLFIAGFLFVVKEWPKIMDLLKRALHDFRLGILNFRYWLTGLPGIGKWFGGKKEHAAIGTELTNIHSADAVEHNKQAQALLAQLNTEKDPGKRKALAAQIKSLSDETQADSYGAHHPGSMSGFEIPRPGIGGDLLAVGGVAALLAPKLMLKLGWELLKVPFKMGWAIGKKILTSLFGASEAEVAETAVGVTKKVGILSKTLRGLGTVLDLLGASGLAAVGGVAAAAAGQTTAVHAYAKQKVSTESGGLLTGPWSLLKTVMGYGTGRGDASMVQGFKNNGQDMDVRTMANVYGKKGLAAAVGVIPQDQLVTNKDKWSKGEGGFSNPFYALGKGIVLNRIVNNGLNTDGKSIQRDKNGNIVFSSNDEKVARAIAKQQFAYYTKGMSLSARKSGPSLSTGGFGYDMSKVAGLTGTKKQTADMIIASAKKYGVSPTFALGVANQESSMGTNLIPKDKNGNILSSARGVYQNTDANWATYGNGGKRMDAQTDIDANMRAFKTYQTSLTKSLGRQPTDTEMYMAHVFGLAGATHILKAGPDAKMSDAVVGLSNSDAILANNHVTPGMTVAQYEARTVSRSKGGPASFQASSGAEIAGTDSGGQGSNLASGSGTLMDMLKALTGGQIYAGAKVAPATSSVGQTSQDTAVGSATKTTPQMLGNNMMAKSDSQAPSLQSGNYVDDGMLQMLNLFGLA